MKPQSNNIRLQNNRLQSSFLQKELRKIAESTFSPRIVEKDQIWKCVPIDAHLVVLDSKDEFGNKKKELGILDRNGHFWPEREQVSSPWVHVKYNKDWSLSLFPRTGLIVTPNATIENRNRTVVTFGTSNPNHSYITTLRLFRRENNSSLPAKIYYRYYRIWGVSGKPQSELLSYHSHLNNYFVNSAEDSKQEVSENSKRLFCQAIGLHTINNKHNKFHKSKKDKAYLFQQREIILIKFNPNGKAVPCLVISPEQLNKFGKITVVRSIKYVSNDDNEPTLLPVTISYDKKVSFDLFLIRGIQVISNFISPCSPKKLISDTEWEELTGKMRDIYV